MNHEVLSSRGYLQRLGDFATAGARNLHGYKGRYQVAQHIPHYFHASFSRREQRSRLLARRPLRRSYILTLELTGRDVPGGPRAPLPHGRRGPRREGLPGERPGGQLVYAINLLCRLRLAGSKYMNLP